MQQVGLGNTRIFDRICSKKTPHTLVLSTQIVLEEVWGCFRKGEDSPKTVREFIYFGLWLGFKVVGVAWWWFSILELLKLLVGFCVCIHNKPLTAQSVKVMVCSAMLLLDGAFCRTNQCSEMISRRRTWIGRGRFERLRSGDDVQQLTKNPMRLADELLSPPLTCCFSAAQS